MSSPASEPTGEELHASRRPNRTKSIISTVILITIIAFAAYYFSDTANVAEFNAFIKAKVNTATNMLTKIPLFNTTSNTGIYKGYFLGVVKTPGGVLVNSYGEFVVLINNKEAEDPTYAQLLTFLKSDKTDQYPYQQIFPTGGTYTGSPESIIDIEKVEAIIDGTAKSNVPRICSDFAEMLHNNAERAGIRCAYISINLNGCSDPTNLGTSSDTGHALVSFNTTDKGLIYIDDTGITSPKTGVNYDKIIDRLEVGESYVPRSLFPKPGWSPIWENGGTVTSIYVTWDGNWRN